jgi:hypothetical protein
MYSFTRTDIDLEAIRGRIARMSDAELRKYGEDAVWMAASAEGCHACGRKPSARNRNHLTTELLSVTGFAAEPEPCAPSCQYVADSRSSLFNFFTKPF